MNKVKDIAQYLVQSYESLTGSSFEDSELRLHKLMYYAQKTSLALTGQELFDEKFEGWRHGPVLTSLRFYFEDFQREEYEELDLTETEKYIIDNTIYEYGQYAVWTLRNLTHDESAWKKSRVGLSDQDYGYRDIALSDIKKDASEVRIYDHQYDMYLDEFDDIEGEFVSVEE